MSRNKDQTWNIKEVAQYLKHFPKTDNDRFIGCAGSEGSGKSVFSLILSREIKAQKKEEFNISEILFYDRAKLVKLLEDTYEQVAIDDEAVREFARTFYKKEQIEYVKMTKVIRSHRHIVYKNIPILWELDKSLRNRIAIYFFIRKKPLNGKPGQAWFFQREERAFGVDPWNLKDNLKLERQGRIHVSPNFYGEIIIPNYEGKAWFTEMMTEYNRIKEAEKGGAYGKKSSDNIDITTASEILVKLQRAKALQVGSLRSVADELGITYQHLRNTMSDVRHTTNKDKEETNGTNTT